MIDNKIAMRLKRFTFLLIVAVMLFTGCAGQGAREKGAADAALYISQLSEEIDNSIIRLQKDLNLSFRQTEILYLMKSDMLAQIPAVREQFFTFQMNLTRLLESDSVSEEEVAELLKALNLYETIFKESVVKRFVELHATLSTEQKERLASYLDKGNHMPFRKKSFPFGHYGREFRELYKELALTGEQKRELREFGKELRQLGKEKKSELKEQARERKAELKRLILADTVTEEEFDTLAAAAMIDFADFQALSVRNIREFHNSLSREQREVLIRFIADFNPL